MLLLSVGIPSLLLSYHAIRMARAVSLGGSDNADGVRKAIRLDPSNPGLYRRLGLIYMFSSDEANPDEAVTSLKKATNLGPYHAEYWSDLASACEWARDLACSDEATNRSLELSPMVPRLMWNAANHYVRTNRPEMALPFLRRLLTLSTDYSLPVFSLCSSVFGDSEPVLRQVLPGGRNPGLRLSLLEFLSSRGRLDAANRVWPEIAANGASIPTSQVQPYLDRLIASGQTQQALSVWNDLQRLDVVGPSEQSGQSNLVYNGGFEQPPSNAGFDWRSTDVPYLSVDFRDPSASNGKRCLRVDFTVKRNDTNEPVSQFVLVVPGAAYTLAAYVRTADITSDSGPALRVTDPACESCLDMHTERTVGTTPWHLVSLKFKTGEQTHLIRLSVWRPRSRAFPSEISGSFWLDAVSITPDASMPAGGTLRAAF